MIRDMIRKGLPVLLAIILALSIMTGCDDDDDDKEETKAVKPDEIRIGVIGGQTGQAASAVAPIMKEIEHFFSYINEVEGGIDGVELKWRMVDDQSTPEGGIMAYKSLEESFNPLIYVNINDFTLAGVADQLNNDNAVVFTYSAITPELYTPPGSFFGIGIPVSDGFAGFIKWVLDDWKGSGPPKVGVLFWDRQTGYQWKLAEAWAKQQGVELVDAAFAMNSIDLKPQLLTFKDAGVDYIWCMDVAMHAQFIVRDFTALGMTVEETPLCFNEFLQSDVYLKMVGSAGEGYLNYQAESPNSEGTEAAQLYSTIWKWATGDDEWSDERRNITLIAVIKAAVKQAVNDVGWDNLDSAAIYDALNKLDTIDTLGNMHNFGYGPDRRIGVSTVKVSRIAENGAVAISDWIELPRIFEGIEQ